ncbi:MAG TPA: PIG-L family deacetylase [Acidimicrobiales bacterium]|nr:PIG-L family deacetylase [Acidimicrobiales bacterium]
MTSAPTLVCVHAHPDDEALFTAGITAHYAARGGRVVLITCTNGQLGIDGAGRPGSHPDHDVVATRATRAAELLRAAELVGYSRVVTLGFDDSGLPGWAQNTRASAFVHADPDAVARTLAALFDEVGATVVVTYDENGFYGHPDHIMANTVTRRAIELSSSVERLYYPVAPKRVLESFIPLAKQRGVFMPVWVMKGIGVDDDVVATTMDVAQHAGLKQRAMATHASQVDNADLVTMDEELFSMLFGVEYYQRAWSRNSVTGDEHDLFGGLI